MPPEDPLPLAMVAAAEQIEPADELVPGMGREAFEDLVVGGDGIIRPRQDDEVAAGPVGVGEGRSEGAQGRLDLGKGSPHDADAIVHEHHVREPACRLLKGCEVGFRIDMDEERDARIVQPPDQPLEVWGVRMRQDDISQFWHAVLLHSRLFSLRAFSAEVDAGSALENAAQSMVRSGLCDPRITEAAPDTQANENTRIHFDRMGPGGRPAVSTA